MLRTEPQQEASRANGAKSQGPVTPEGKARVGRQEARLARQAQKAEEHLLRLKAQTKNYQTNPRGTRA